MKNLKMLAGLLDSPGGHIIAGFVLLVIGLTAEKLGSGQATALIVAGSTMVTMGAKGLNGKGAGVKE